MEQKKEIKISLKTFIIIAIIITIAIVSLGIFLYKNLQGESKEQKNADKVFQNNSSEEVEISEEDKEIVENYFKGKWIGTNNDKTIIINSDMTFSVERNNKEVEKGTFTVKGANSNNVAHIILNYSNGTKIDFELVQGANSNLWSDDTTDKYEFCEK